MASVRHLGKWTSTISSLKIVIDNNGIHCEATAVAFPLSGNVQDTGFNSVRVMRCSEYELTYAVRQLWLPKAKEKNKT